MGERDKALVVDGLVWLFNVSTSVVIVFVNKILMGKAGYLFNFATTLCAFHFLSCAIMVKIMEAAGLSTQKAVPWKDKLIFALAANVSISSLNLSLMINSVGFYQIAKLLIIPFTAAVEFLWLQHRMSIPQLICTGVVVAGVAIVTVSDVSVNMLGVGIAALSVASSAMQQILCRYYQKKHALQSNELLGATAPVQGVSLLILGPLVDRLVVGRWVASYEVNVPALSFIGFSCAIAVLVNISQFMCLGRFSAVTFQVTGHAKTVMVLLGGWLYLNEAIGPKELVGMACAVVGMIAYGYFASLPAPADKSAHPPPAERQGAAEGKPLIIRI